MKESFLIAYKVIIRIKLLLIARSSIFLCKWRKAIVYVG